MSTTSSTHNCVLRPRKEDCRNYYARSPSQLLQHMSMRAGWTWGQLTYPLGCARSESLSWSLACARSSITSASKPPGFDECRTREALLCRIGEVAHVGGSSSQGAGEYNINFCYTSCNATTRALMLNKQRTLGISAQHNQFPP